MIRQFRPQNFRIFTKDTCDFHFKPITFLTGSNSSGKSSLVKAIMVVRDYIESLRNRYSIDGTFNPSEFNLNLSSMDLKMGTYISCVNKDSDEDTISFTYDASSDLAPFLFEVTLSFGKSSKGDAGVEGELISIEIKLSDEVVLRMKRENNKLKLESIKCDGYLMYCFIDFMKSMYSTHSDEDVPEEWAKYKKASHETYFKNRQIQDRYPALFRTNLRKSLEKLDESSLMFYFPILNEFIGLSKEDSLAKLYSFRCPESLNYSGDFRGTLERVIESFKKSALDTFTEYYLSLENSCLQEFNHRFWPTGYNTRYDLIRDEICKNMELECRSNRENSWPVEEFESVCTLLTMVSWDDEELSTYFNHVLSYEDDYGDGTYGRIEFYSSNLLYSAFCEFIHLLINEVLLTSQFTNVRYVNDSFTGVQRMYTYADKSSFAQVIREYTDLQYLLDGRGRNSHQNEYYNKVVEFHSGDFINKWLKEFCDIDSLLITSDEDGQGFLISVRHTNGLTTPLADEGHGITQLVHLLLQIECQVLRKKRSILDIPNQFTINYDSLDIDSPVLAIEEPEVSLHPSLQSKLSLVFEDAYLSYRLSFIIETHSEYLIRKSQAIISQYDLEGKNFEDNPFKIYYFNPDGSSYEIGYRESGRLTNPFGPGFFDEAGNSSLEVLKREQRGHRK